MDNTVETAEQWREEGKIKIASDDAQIRREGIELIDKARCANDSEAGYIFGKMFIDGRLRLVDGDSREFALSILNTAAWNGSMQARALLNRYCMDRYLQDSKDVKTVVSDGPLVDFDAKKIKINRKGLLTPVDAVLDYTDGINTLTLSANLVFILNGVDENASLIKQAVIEGIKMWEGDYKVFGNQQLKVVVNLTTEPRIVDSVYIFNVSDEVGAQAKKMSEHFGSKAGERTQSLIESKRSYATQGLKKWTARSRKLIFLQSDDGKFDDYYEIKHVAKHEFGHALGLGDLYESKSDNLKGVEKGSYFELDGFLVSENYYNLVMCDHHGPISNNDIEMVVLAFWKNKAQLYQANKPEEEVSKALGRGN